MLSVDIDENLPKSLDKDGEAQAKAELVTEPPSSSPEPLPRKFERFTLLSRVARGGMGEVYLATAQSIEGAERPLIVKIVRPDHADDRSFVARFLDEARIQSQLSHPGVAQILEATVDAQGKPYVVVEHVEGKNLSEVRSRAGQLGVRLSWPEAIALGICLGEALAHVHERTDAEGRPLDIVHRDLSPQNVMVGYAGEIKLIDFGTARGQNRRCQTVAGIVFAKPGYVAPEVANNEPGGVPADLYAFGVILWELLAGRRFLSGEASQHMAAVGAGKRTLPPLARLIGAPPEVDALLARLTATSLDARYPSARAATLDVVKLLQRAPSLADGDRSVRGRIADLMRRLYPAEPARSRADFARRVAEARSRSASQPLPPPSPEPPEANEPGVLAGTRYRLLREIGRGAMGVVHEAVHLDLGRTVAVKLLSADAMSPIAQSRFRAEARAIAALEHENLVKIYDFGACNDGRLYSAMELLEGESLDKHVSREKRLSEKSAVQLGVQVCRALEAAHRAGVVHRDIKPANLFLTNTGGMKVLDFGVAKSGPEASPVTVADELYLLGTPEYMAPEQARGEADARSDVYALGTVLYELVTGVLPFDGEGPLAILAQKSAHVPAAPSTLAPKGACSEDLDRILVRALDPDPARRFSDVTALRRELEATLVPKVAQPPRSRRLGVAALSFTIAGCLTVLGAAGMQNPRVRGAVEGVTTRVSERIDAARKRYDAARERRAELAARGPVQAAPVAPRAAALEPLLPAAAALSQPLAEEPIADPPQAETSQEDAPQTGAANAAKSEADVALARADALAHEGRELKALELLRRTAEKHGAAPGVLRALANALAKNRSWGEAVRVARRAVELDPSPEMRLDLARLERATGHRERAIAILQALVQDERAGTPARELLRGLTGNDEVALRD